MGHISRLSIFLSRKLALWHKTLNPWYRLSQAKKKARAASFSCGVAVDIIGAGLLGAAI